MRFHQNDYVINLFIDFDIVQGHLECLQALHVCSQISAKYDFLKFARKLQLLSTIFASNFEFIACRELYEFIKETDFGNCVKALIEKF